MSAWSTASVGEARGTLFLDACFRLPFELFNNTVSEAFLNFGGHYVVVLPVIRVQAVDRTRLLPNVGFHAAVLLQQPPVLCKPLRQISSTPAVPKSKF